MANRHMKKVLIANRGEIAVRILRTCREMGIRTVAVYSDADRTMPHVLKADEAYNIGPAPSRESYLNAGRIIDVARRTGSDAIHPGFGFLSENADFAQQVVDAGLLFIGPRPESIRAMGDKTGARKLMMKANVPTVPGTADPIVSESEVESFARKHDFPILIKAAAGGGGKGMRVVHTNEELSSALSGAKSEALKAFADDRVYVEKYLENPRHIEFQILADEYGNTVHLGERECSIQRRHQKVIEETPSVIVDDALRSKMGSMAVAAAKACGYVNAGTIECLVDRNRNFYFLEMNTRLQVEHPITEMRTGIDLVAQQLRIATGEKLAFAQEDIDFRGHAIECRIYAEDVTNNFLPSTGRIVHLRPSQGFGIRDDRGVEEGSEISLYYDPMIAKLVVLGQTRSEAINRMVRALREYEILGVKTTIPLCLFVLQHPKFVQGDIDTHFIPEYFATEHLTRFSDAEVTVIAAVSALLEQTASNGSNAATVPSEKGFAHSSRWKLQRFQGMRR